METDGNPPAVSPKKHRQIIVPRTVLGTVRKLEDQSFALDINTLISTTKVRIEWSDKLFPVEGLDQHKVGLTAHFNRLTRELTIQSPFNVSKVFVKHCIKQGASTKRPVKRRLEDEFAKANAKKPQI